MIDLKKEVQAALKDVCVRVVYGDYRGFAERELLCWRESGNRSFAQADGREYLTELGYALEIYAPGAEDALAMLKVADARMCALGFRRESAVEQFEHDLRISHVSARYRALVDVQGRVYQ